MAPEDTKKKCPIFRAVQALTGEAGKFGKNFEENRSIDCWEEDCGMYYRCTNTVDIPEDLRIKIL